MPDPPGGDRRRTVFVGSHVGRAYGLDLASGRKVWEYEAASAVRSSPAAAKGKAVAAGRRPGHLLRITPHANS
jgi:outer membrane protein assembly factor BamB